MSQGFRSTVLPLLAALIWGISFVGQSTLAAVMPPLAITALRSIIACLALLAAVFLFRCFEKKRGRMPQKQDKRSLLIGGVATGVALTAAANLQQAGLVSTSAGKASFITALYIVLVPICGIFLGKKVTGRLWLAVVLATVGLYLISVGGAFRVERGDLFVFLCALCFACHILVVDHFTKKVDPLCLSCMQFATCTVLSGIASLLTEEVQLSGVPLGTWLWPLLYIGFFSSGVGFTLQILAQQGGDAALVSLLLSLESVFGAFAGAVLLHERMSAREILGCFIMFIAIVLAQLPVPVKKRAPDR